MLQPLLTGDGVAGGAQLQEDTAVPAAGSPHALLELAGGPTMLWVGSARVSVTELLVEEPAHLVPGSDAASAVRNTPPLPRSPVLAPQNQSQGVPGDTQPGRAVDPSWMPSAPISQPPGTLVRGSILGTPPSEK